MLSHPRVLMAQTPTPNKMIADIFVSRGATSTPINESVISNRFVSRGVAFTPNICCHISSVLAGHKFRYSNATSFDLREQIGLLTPRWLVKSRQTFAGTSCGMANINHPSGHLTNRCTGANSPFGFLESFPSFMLFRFSTFTVLVRSPGELNR